MPQIRQLAAIMFSDIVGYTALMGDDEQKAFELLKLNRQLQKPLIEKYGGQWIKEIGDGVLASFPTITDAVTCACQIQQDSSFVSDLRLRIGIHQGEVMFEDGDVFGDGVNIASRLQALAPIGGIWVSESVYHNVANKKGIEIHFVKEETLKNVKQPVRIYEVMLAGQSAKTSSPEQMPKSNANHFDNQPRRLVKQIPEKSIAVLPFVNLSNDPEQDYFSDGMAEEIINSLSHLKDLKVAGRSSSFQFKGSKIDLQDVRERLGVRTVLEGSIRKYGNIIRLTAQLINVEDGFHIWSERYEKTLDDIFAIQDEIAQSITEKLKVTLIQNDQQVKTRVNTHNPQAYELYLKGRFHLNRRGISILQSLELFEQAIALDPDFALAYAGLADACFLLAVYSLRPGTELMPRGREAAERALELDDTLFEPYTSLGFYYAAHEWNWEKSKKYFLKALENNPTYVIGHCWYALYYLSWIEKDFKAAEIMCKTAIQIDSLSAFPHMILASVYFAEGRFEDALKVADTAIDIDMGAYLAHRVKGNCLVMLNRFKEAIEYQELVTRDSKKFPLAMGDLLMAYAYEGSMDKAKAVLEEMINYPSKGIYVCPHLMTQVLGWVGEVDKALEWFQKAFDTHDPELLVCNVGAWTPPALKDHPKYIALVEKMNFPKN
jgi:TolB-like protein/class 3 adenylate cyclase/Tfp pilus assembly protein PilF